MTMIEIKKYDVAYYAGAKNVAGHPYRAIIGLRNDNDGLIGAAYFHHNTSTMPIADTRKASGYISCHYPAEDYPQVLDLLRNEKPVYVEFEVRAGNVASIKIAPATAQRILKRAGRVVKPVVEKTTTRFERAECNELAQMDFKGEYTLGSQQKCYPLTLLDDRSRFLHGLWPLSSTGAVGVKQTLEGHFREQGVPLSILMDHGTPWFSTTNQHGLTWVAVWLIKQGVWLRYSGIGHPQTQGKVERFHRTLKARTKHRGVPTTLQEWREWAAEFRQEYNHERPHEALAMKTPAAVYKPVNLRPYQEQPREWDYSGAMVKRLNTQGMLYYKQQTYFVSEALAAERVRVDELEDKLVVTFRHLTVREIDMCTGRSTAVLLPAPTANNRDRP